MHLRVWVGSGLLILGLPGIAAADSAAPAFVSDARYDDKVPSPAECLGFEPGSRAASSGEIEGCLGRWAQASPRTLLSEIGKSHEGRSLWNLVVTSAANVERLKKIQEGWARIADPRKVGGSELESLAGSLPAVAYLAFSIHGDETSGADAALMLAHHLIAATDPQTLALLEEVVVVIDPMLNPDGRDRFLAQLAQGRGSRSDRDDQSLSHTGSYPWGRGNHYLFDLNRDWLAATQPEVRARIEAVRRWNPLLLIDAHEMGPQETYLFYPPRPPINPYVPDGVRRWWDVFGRDQAAAFDRHGWLYYTGEWSEEWFPGYTNSWASYRGAIGILYEQAGISFGHGELMRPEGPATYRDSVRRQLTSALANLDSLWRNRKKIARDFLATRQRAVAAEGPFAERTWAVPAVGTAGSNADRLERFVESLRLQGIEVYQNPQALTVADATNALGDLKASLVLPAGSLLIPARQPEAHLLGALLDFDIRLEDGLLARERREVLRWDRSLLYDVSAWSQALFYGLELWRLPIELPPKVSLYRSPADPPRETRLEGVALVVSGGDDRVPALAARWLEQGLEVRVSDRAFELSGRRFERGSLVLARNDQAATGLAQPFELAAESAAALGLAAMPVATGLGEGELPDLGGQHFPLLEKPRVGVVTRGEVDSTDFGAVWYLLDRDLGLSHSHLDEATLGQIDLRRYNVLVLPDRARAELPAGLAERLEQWVAAGGTLIAFRQAAAALAREGGPSKVRTLPDVLGEIGSYRLGLLQEWLSEGGRPSPEEVWSRTPAVGWADPWEEIPLPGAEEKADWQRRDEWQARFMPQGALLAARVDTEHWLTFGVSSPLPVLFAKDPILMSRPELAEAVIRLGYTPPPVSEADGFMTLGWGLIPGSRPFTLRMAGLLWPEAAQRLANGAYLTRERHGNGQIVLFAASPVFRAQVPATARLLANAVVFGPGLGTRQPLFP
ncbi:MAG TPA: M14 family metallopeptidase [Thermoanaerobaculia bacterium]|nr:M14 family metallopeptidase [Thermoanaerobaculia bacterium]